MSMQKYCQLLLVFRNEGIRFRTFMSARWFIVKAVLLAVSLAIVSTEDAVVRTVGLVVLGFVLGTTTASIRSYVVTKRYWVCQRELLDWPKVEACMKQPNS